MKDFLLGVGLVIAVLAAVWAAWSLFCLVAAFFMAWGPHD